MTTSSPGFRRWRRAAFAAQALLVAGLPFVRVGGESALRFDVPSLTLLCFGARLQIDELFVVTAVALALCFAFALGTLLLGRAWCGWACPQTVLSELTRLSGPARWPAIAGVSAFAAANLLWYFVPPDDFLVRAARGELGPVLGGAWAVLSATLFLDLALVRQRFCATVCPYAKLQGALYDRRTLVVAYDQARAADCVACGACLRACPTDIDIRRGLQTECIACAECADACAPVMARLGRPNLVAYAWGEVGAPRRLVRGTTVALAGVTAAAVSLAAAVSFSRADLDLAAARAPGTLAARTADGRALNAYDLSLTNRGRAPLDLALALTAGGEPAALRPESVRLAPGEHRQVRVLAAVRLPAGASGPLEADLVVRTGGVEARTSRRLTFVLPEEGRTP